MAEDDPPLLEQIVEGISDGCLQSAAALVGGETAIMPDLYQPGDYDLAGFCVGIVERSRLLDGTTISPGDTVLGVASSGIHSNGYSLVRKIVFEHAGLGVDDVVELGDAAQFDNETKQGEFAFDELTVGQLLLEPTTIYARAVRDVLNHYKVKTVVHGIAHITGGGLHENLSRILPDTVDAEITPGSWPVPPVFDWLQKLGNVDDDEMYQVFNMGIGLAIVVSSYYAESIQQQLAQNGLKSWLIGQIVPGSGGARWA